MKRHHILIVDDDEAILGLVERLLEAEGIRTVCCRDGQEAIGFLEVCRFDVVVSDESMPGKRGREVALWLRETAALKDVPLLLMSGEPPDDKIKRLLKDGTITAFISKPFRMRTLINLVSCLLKEPSEKDYPKIIKSGA